MTPEARLKADIKAYLDQIGAWHFAVQSHGYGVRGIPDIVGVHKGRGFAIEAKVAPRQPTPFQKIQLARCAEAGGVAILAYSLEDVKESLS